ncbi:hypothetical protein L5515_003430 [Caenorhabditis briggsae]|uniref:Uncharacterized protein n=1 Tax=Caenorhabditis briggsae TaxID=6238 RepID=A0AAE9EM18_CAEBR|nr:hypothetical protein L5515_003430 [Caenorhabditis briggsae]
MDEQIIDDDPGFPSLATQKDVRMVLSALEQLNIKMDKLAEARAARRTKTIQTRLRTMPRAIPQTIAGQFPMKAKQSNLCPTYTSQWTTNVHQYSASNAEREDITVSYAPNHSSGFAITTKRRKQTSPKGRDQIDNEIRDNHSLDPGF